MDKELVMQVSGLELQPQYLDQKLDECGRPSIIPGLSRWIQGIHGTNWVSMGYL